MNWPIRIAVGCLVAALACGCRPKSSPDFAEAQALHAKLFAEKLDEAYLEPEMTRVEELLARVPQGSRDQKPAAELLAKIQSERTRMETERLAREAAIADALKPVEAKFDSAPQPAPYRDPVEAPVPTPAPDAGLDHPMPGMPEAELTARFSDCFAPSLPIDIASKGRCASLELKDLGLCRQRHPGFDTKVVVVCAGKVLGVLPKSQVQTQPDDLLPDGGRVAADAGP